MGLSGCRKTRVFHLNSQITGLGLKSKLPALKQSWFCNGQMAVRACFLQPLVGSRTIESLMTNLSKNGRKATTAKVVQRRYQENFSFSKASVLTRQSMRK